MSKSRYKPPTEPTPALLSVVVMPNGELICAGQTLAWLTANADVACHIHTQCAACGADEPGITTTAPTRKSAKRKRRKGED